MHAEPAAQSLSTRHSSIVHSPLTQVPNVHGVLAVQETPASGKLWTRVGWHVAPVGRPSVLVTDAPLHAVAAPPEPPLEAPPFPAPPAAAPLADAPPLEVPLLEPPVAGEPPELGTWEVPPVAAPPADAPPLDPPSAEAPPVEAPPLDRSPPLPACFPIVALSLLAHAGSTPASVRASR